MILFLQAAYNVFSNADDVKINIFTFKKVEENYIPNAINEISSIPKPKKGTAKAKPDVNPVPVKIMEYKPEEKTPGKVEAGGEAEREEEEKVDLGESYI